MKDVRKKVQARKLFSDLVDKYHQYCFHQTKSQLHTLKPLPRSHSLQIDPQFFRTATLVKTLQVMVNKRQRRAFTLLSTPTTPESYYN